MLNAGQQVVARISLKGGNPGQYFLRAWRAINTGNDEIVAQWSFIYDGAATSQQLSFSPSYALGESGTRGYWLDLVGNSEQVWILPDTYPPRLTVAPRPGFGSLTVVFNGWYTGSKSTYTVKKGQEVAAGVSLSGGDAGKYVLRVKSDLSGMTDGVLDQISLDYDGSSALQWITFTPARAVNESACNGYYLELIKEGKYIWSLSGGYPPRLTVTK
jgi:hypothetical protein